MDIKIASNKELWDSRVAGHMTSKFYDMESFRAGRNSLPALDVEVMGSVEGLSLLHLQCHFGQDTLSWGRLGASVTGVDLSDAAVEAARGLSDELGVEARFHRSNVLEYEPDRTYDRVYTSYGVLGWLPDLKPWARVVSQALAPGGEFLLAEFHPLLMMYDFPSRALKYDYFHKGGEELVSGSYADTNDATERVEYFWSHTLADILTPLLAEGLRLVEIQELPWSPYGCFEGMEEESPGRWVYPGSPVRLPHTLVLKMAKPKL